MLGLRLVCLAALGAAASAQAACGFDRLTSVKPILAGCCESTRAKDCSKGFPKTCPLACAKLIVPLYNACRRTLPSLGLKFQMKPLKVFVQNCEHTQELFHHSTDQCADNAKEKEQRVLDVTSACCHQKGKFVCANEVPWACNAECATTYVPFFDQCVKRDTAVSVKSLSKYTHLYEQCANVGSGEVHVLLSNVNKLVENPKCRVNTTGIVTRGKKFVFPPFNPGAPCHDDNKALGKKYPGNTCLSAAAHKACNLNGVAKLCSCACKVELKKVSCHDNEEGLRTVFKTSAVTCLSAASSGACHQIPKVANLCGCSCKTGQKQCTHPPCTPIDGPHGRRLQSSANKLNFEKLDLGLNPKCKWDSFNDRIFDVTRTCCPKGGCGPKQVPSRCSFDCGHKFSAFMVDCGALFSVVVFGSDRNNRDAMGPYMSFLKQCQDLDPRSLATAIYSARCAECGNGKVEVWFHEECDDGPRNSNKPNACRPNCKKPFCGDGIKDVGEQCDKGKAGSNSCSRSCKVICPELSVPEKMKITYSGGGQVYGAKATYSCSETGAAPSDGTAVRACKADGTWSGTAPTQCFEMFPNSKIVTKASWGVQINSWLPSKWQNKKWTLCYSSFLHPTNKPSQFHSRCDKYTGTISLGWNKRYKKTFGAFHEGTWAGSGGWDSSSKADFLFKLGDSLEKFPNKGQGNYAYKYPAYWPLFGSGDDLDWGYGKLGTNSECTAHSYSGHVTNEICGGRNWGTTHLEVWRLA